MKQILSFTLTFTGLDRLTVKPPGLRVGGPVTVVSFGIEPRLSRLITDEPFWINKPGAANPVAKLNDIELGVAATATIVALGYRISLPSAGHFPAVAFCAMN